MKKIQLCVSCLVLGLASTAAAQSETVTETTAPAPTPAEKKVEEPSMFHAEYRLWGEAVDVADFDSNEDESEAGLYQRISAGFDLDITPQLALHADIQALAGELAAGQVYPEPPDERVITGANATGSVVDDHHNIVDPFELYLTYNPGIAQIRAGLQRSDFGMGLVANGGQEQPWDLFNQKFGADRSVRVLFATAPFAILSKKRIAKKVFLAVGADMVYRDDNANFVEGDRAWQGVGSLFYRDANPVRPEESTFLGFYSAMRRQDDREIDGIMGQDDLEATAFDVSGHKAFSTMDEQLFVKVAGEAAMLVGSTSRAYTLSSLNEETDIVAAGAVGDVRLTWKPHDLTFRLLSGYASGDANPDDDTLYRFRFDPNYKVGLVLYDHYLPAATRVAYNRIDNPERSGEPPKGVFGLVNDGAIENTVYLNPQFLFGDPEGLLTGVGVLWAWSAEPLADPYNSFANGGVPAGINGREEASHQLGVEVDVAARYRLSLWRHLKLETKVEYGILFPGAAFEDAAGNSAAATSVVRGRLALLW